MKIFKNLFILIWRIWFYIIFILSVVIVLPVLIIVISNDRFYKTFYKIATLWGRTILFCMGFWSEVERLQELSQEKSYMFIANHTSMIDIMLMLSVIRHPLVFVGKKELAKIPIFGYVYKRTCITVDRNCIKSKKGAYDEAEKRLKNGLSVCIFPEGLVPEDENIVLSEFKNGAFRLAIEHQIPIVPISFYDCKKRFSYTFFSGAPGKLRVKVHPFIETKGFSSKDRKLIKDRAFELIHNDLAFDQQV